MNLKRPLQIILFLLSLTLAGCLPDSFTKFKEDPPQGIGASPPPVATGSPGNLIYPESGFRYRGIARLTLSVLNIANFSVGGSISSEVGGSGTIASISGNQITIQVTSGTFTSQAPVNNIDNTSFYIASESTVDDVSFSIRQKLQIVSSAGLSIGSLISNAFGDYGTILEVVNGTEFVVGLYIGSFMPSDAIDDTSPFSTVFDSISQMSFIFMPDEPIDLRPTLPIGESVTYGLGSPLPNNFSAFDGNFGFIQGNQNASDLISITVNAQNSSGSVGLTFSIGPEESSPQNMNFSQDLLLNITSTANFSIGEEVTTPASGGDGLGIIKRVIDSNNLHIRLIKGFFTPGEGIDNISPYGGEKAQVNLVSPITEVLYVPNGGSSSFGRKGFISSQGNTGQGIISYIDPNGGSDDIIYIFTYRGSFLVGDAAILSIDNNQTYVAQETTVNKIEAPNMKLKLASSANFSKGIEITTTDGATGIINDVDSFNNNVFVEVDNNGFTHQDAANDDVDNFNPYSAPESNITEISADNTFYLYRDEEVRLNAFLRKGSSPTWSITPNLPEGLSIDTNNGHISGTPTESSAKKVYLVTATNLINGAQFQETFSFFLQVYDHFSIKNVTDGATSYILHRQGRKNGSAKCRITSDQIQSSTFSNKDIVCRLEGEEKDILQIGLELEVNSSAGICQFMVHTPYNFYARSVAATTNHTVYLNHIVAAGIACSPPLLADPEPGGLEKKCISDYTNRTIGKKNCDNGGYIERTVEWSNPDLSDPPICQTEATVKNEYIPCGGNNGACSEGPIRDLTVDANIFTGVTIPSSLGLIRKFTYTSPLDSADIGSNRRLANYVGNNHCSDAGAGTTAGYLYQANNWDAYSTTSYPQAGSGNAATVTIPGGLTSASTIVDRSTVTTSEDLRNDFRSGDMVSINWGAFGTGNHKIQSITAGSIIFVNPFDANITAGAYAISPSLYSEPFKGSRTNPFYTFECQDAAQDTIARIRIQVREWDRKFSINDDIDLLGRILTGTVTSSAGTQALTGAGSLFLPELLPNQMIRFGNQINQVGSIATNTSLTMVDNSPATLAGQTLVSRPLLMDSADVDDLFGQPYNDRDDWDDKNSSGVFPYLNSCGVTPTRDNQRRDNYFDFQGGFYKN